MMIKLILWDIGNVLIRAKHAITHQTLMNHGVPPDRAKRFFTCDAYRDFARGQIDGLRFYYAQVAENLRFDLSLAQMIRAHDEHMYKPDPLVLSLVERCTVPIAFATNTNEWQNYRERELIGGIELYKPVWTFRSNEHGMLKTDSGCMNYIGQALKMKIAVEPPEILLIDDSLGNRRAAYEAGFSTYRYAPNNGAPGCEKFLLSQKLLK